MDQMTAENLRLFLVFFVPGFVASKVYRLLSPGPIPEASSLLLEAVSYSMLNLGITFWVPLVLWQNRYFFESPVLFVTTGVLVLVISPAALAVAIAKGRRARWLHKHVVHPAASSWDYFFEPERRACFVLATLQDGTSVGGYWGPNSFASSFPHSGDLYLEQTWKVVDGLFAGPVVGTAGCHLRASECRVIEFIVAQEAASGGEDTHRRGDGPEAGQDPEGGLPAAVRPAEPGTAPG